MSDREKKPYALDAMAVALTVALTSALIPLMFPKEISVSPFLLFGIIFLTNLVPLFLPEDAPHNGQQRLTRLFFTRLLVSVVFAALLILVWKIARSF
ncbi:hypothetical protein G4G28_17175 [Massilia sp. Dwa41.01b]|uniref:hypothetical protein n=1 Tax=unclassified Massilia TaxID=2609279 RepID=UPI0016028342|nr:MULTISPECIES: hypothetical protein [unclassified Massilia]QNA89780.1 hypothetical protein G4G28_17175 [Massilia sp. Dwa41.01b]QNB00674.1 hypothetical protein G4G31_20755 [Massilia sp. Se16.2.3]